MFFYIKDNIFLSNLHDASNMWNIQDYDIEIVIRLSEDCNEKPKYYGDYIAFYNFILEDNLLYSKEIIAYSKEIYEIILNNENKNILIHCNEGKSRSVSAVIYYLCKKYSYSFEEVYDYVKTINNDIKITNAFSYELRKLFSRNVKIIDSLENICTSLKNYTLEDVDINVDMENEYDENSIISEKSIYEEEYKEECLRLLLKKD